MDSHPELALLAPVPLVHLEDGQPVCRKRGKVAYGSRNWTLFRELDDLRAGMPVETYIYASHTDDHKLVVSWHALYIGHVEGIGGLHPAGRKFRPPSAMDDGTGHWAVFWEVTDLKPIPPISIADFCSRGAKAPYGKPFVPEGPIIVERP